ncbi:MAG: hypothetical protein ACLU78_05445 [Clostridium sp.]|uniref:hypothetical protein n=1 Tax=Eubacterium sp. TaxID=142586 RepID=UPI000ECCDD23|nr:hypothetical protein [Clostridium sp.]MEE0632085.1 hypothetical protein [Eubacterium sp.]HCI65788.1 hypothetical protein [Lachnospiraceae bacterium]
MTLCRKCGKEIPDGEELCEDCKNKESQMDEAYLEELMQNMSDEEKEPENAGEPAPVMDEQVEEKPAEEASDGEADVNDLLALLSQDYEDYDESDSAVQPEEEVQTAEPMDESPAETSLFREDDEKSVFADDANALSVDDVYDDALSAVDYSEADEAPEFPEIEEEFVPQMDEDAGDDFGDLALDPLVLDDSEAAGVSGEPLVVSDDTEADVQDIKQEKEKKDGFFKRIFGNIITEQSAEEEAKEREKEQADAEEKKAAKEEKKQQTAEEKAAKAEQAKEEKEKKAAAKAEQAAAKAAEKEEKKRLRAEQEANEVVGRINPVGAAIVMVFFGLLCVAVVFGSQALSYTTSVKSAESSFEQRDYKNAYDSLAGVSVSDSSKELKQKVRMCMQLQREYDAYQNYYKMKMYLESLDSLIGGIRLYDANKAKAEQYDMLSQYNELESKLANQLYNEFGVSESQARNIIASETQKEYTDRLQAILLQWQKRNEADER